MKFKQAFDLVPGDVVAFVGAGGKTSLMLGLGYELAEAGWRVLATTTTKLAQEQLALFPCALPANTDAREISQALSEKQFAFLYDEIRDGKVYGPSLEWTRHLLDSLDSDILLVKSDDAGGLPFKAPMAGEPRVPPETTLVLALASLSALGAPLDQAHVYNPRAMIDRYGFVENSPIKSPWLAQVLRDEELGLRGIPETARVIVFLNQTPERGYVRGRARMIARLSLQSKRISAVALGSVRGAEPVFELQRSVAALILATGGTNYSGHNSNSSLVERGGRRLARISEQLIRSRMAHIRLVTGRNAVDARKAVNHLRLKAVHNRGWKRGGLISYLRAGIDSLPDHVSAILLVPDDLGRVQPKTLYRLLSSYAKREGDLIVPRCNQRLAPPLLVDRRYWPEVLKLPGHSDLATIIDHLASAVHYLDVDVQGISPESSFSCLQASASLQSSVSDSDA